MLLSMCGHLYSKENVEAHRARINAAAAARAAAAQVKYPCPCGGVYRIRSEENHCRSLYHKEYLSKKN